MTKDFVAEPDLQFTKDLIDAGAGDLKKCYQCATCSVACRISPDNHPYPRKEMIWAQWGLKDKLMADPDVWLCHQCNDCSTQCPRGAYPGEVLKAIRKMHIENAAWPSFMAKIAGNPSLFVLALGIPVVIVLLMTYAAGWRFPESEVIAFKEFIPHSYIQVIFTAALAFGVISLVVSLRNYWRNLNEANPVLLTEYRKDFFPSFVSALGEILPHSTFKDCEANNIRYTSHMLAFWGMIGLLATTAIVAFNVDVLGHILHIEAFEKPPSMNGPGTLPIKILGNVSAIAFIVGIGIMMFRRLNVPEEAGSSSYFDWFMIVLLGGSGVTGLLTELIRLSGSAPGAYTMYVIHLMFVMGLFLYLPFSKFAHLGYRTVAIAWGKSVGRNMTVPTQPNYVPPQPAEEEPEEEKATA